MTLDVEVFGAELAPDGPPRATVKNLCILAAASAGVEEGHVAIEYVDPERISQLNAEHRGKEGPTDVLSFPIDGAAAIDGVAPRDDGPRIDRLFPGDGGAPPGGGAPLGGLALIDDGPVRELGDVVICPQHTVDLREAIVHGVLHLVGMDHETDDGEMLALQAELLASERG